ncbi:MAG: type II toxin-antitoxin system prevent-host-death family antitoxin [bacterium]|nr:type II toxin-antitoxin system prevent-host-death family antitoxin [bacterium]
MDVGIPELKANLSEYVRRAAGGEEIVVSGRGRPVAKLVGLGTSMLESGVAEGWITPPTRSNLTPAVYYRASLSTGEVIDEDRG